MFTRTIIALAAALPATPALADWNHPASGVSVPDAVGDMRVGQERNVTGDGTDVYVQYGTETEPVTLYVYRSSHPNPALWFERTRVAMRSNVGRFDESAVPRPFTLGPAYAPNGQRGEFALAGAPWKSTAVAIAQHGEWLLKARVTSQTLDPAGAAKRLDALLAAIRFANTPKSPPLPLTAPAPCSDEARFTGKPTRSDEARAMGSIMGVVALGQARGIQGLAAEPQLWCRQPVSGELAQAASFYRRLDGSAWTLLLGDAGMAASAYAFPEIGKGRGAGVYFTRTGPALLAETYDALPGPEEGAGAALAVLAGRKPALVTVDMGKAK